MFKIKEINDKIHIYLVSGDTFIAEVGMKQDGKPYEPQAGDEIRFAMKDCKMNSDRTEYIDDEPLVEVNIDPTDRILRIESTDTKELKFKDYDFDIQLTTSNGIVDTFISGILHLQPEVD